METHTVGNCFPEKRENYRQKGTEVVQPSG